MSLTEDGEYLMKFRADRKTWEKSDRPNRGNPAVARLANRQWVAIIGRMPEGSGTRGLVSPE